MFLLVNVSLKRKQKIFDDRAFHLGGEVRVLNTKNNYKEIDRITISENANIVMKGHHKINGGEVVGVNYLCSTYGQVISINLKSKKQKTIITEPFFNDLHHVNYANNEYGVVNTGLEKFHIYGVNCKIKKTYNLLSSINEKKVFSYDKDYRHVWSTKPHYVHANHCFYYDNEWWVTRFQQKDALALESGRCIDLKNYGNPHDGIIFNNNIYFTTTNGCIVKYNFRKDKFKSWDLNSIIGKTQLGWCRGIAIDGDMGYVCFTKFRPSKAIEMAKWIKKPSSKMNLPSRIIIINLRKNYVEKEIKFSEDDLTIFTCKLMDNYV